MSGVWMGRALRTVGALVAVAAVGATALAGARAEPAERPAGGVDAVEVPAPPVSAVCPGPPIMPEGTGQGAFDPAPVDPVSAVSVVALAGDGARVTGTLLSLDGGRLADLSQTAAATVPAVTGATLALADGAGAPVRLAAVASGLVTAGDLRGLLAATCPTPAADAWLVGGSTAVGSTADLVLVNPGTTTAEVTLAAWGANGPVEIPEATQLVGPHAQNVVHLGGAAPEQRSLVVRVATTGGQVAAWLQDGAVRGFTAAGAELVVPAAAPAARVVVPGVLVGDSTADSPDAPLLRLLAPGPDGARAHATLLGADGPVELPGATAVDLPAGQVTDLPLGGLPAGAYTVVVDAAGPVVASVAFSRVGSAGDLDPTPRVERAWAAAAPPGAGLAAPVAGTRTTLVVGAVPDGEAATATGTATGTLRLLGADGAVLAEHRVSVDAGSTGSWALADLVPDPSRVTGVLVLPDDGSTALSWALVAEVPEADGVLASVLLPAAAPVGATTVAVAEDPTLGLG